MKEKVFINAIYKVPFPANNHSKALPDSIDFAVTKARTANMKASFQPDEKVDRLCLQNLMQRLAL
jgi:hypothetical protein